MPWYGSHSFLIDYICKNKCRRIMEIGVLDGENAKSMIKAAFKNFPPEKVEYYGFDFFSGSSLYNVRQKLHKTGCKFQLFKGDTVITLPNIVRTLPFMDVIFIDGGKSYNEAKSDWENSKILMREKTAVFVHNYYFSGVRRMVDNISKKEYYVKILHASLDSDMAFINKRVNENDH